MGFMSVEDYNEEKYRNLFRLTADGESADVIFLYKSKRDLLRADVHYIISDTYTGYVHCLGQGCPVCAVKKADGSQLIRRQPKLFIPVYNIYKNGGVIEFWDRAYNNGFVEQLDREVFNVSPNPSECVFKITRKGGYKDNNTRYSFVAVGRNAVASYEQILEKFNATMPAYYETIVKSFSASELTEMVQSASRRNAPASSMMDYVPTPRAGYQSSIPNTYVNASEALGGKDESSDNDAILSEFDNNDGDEPLPDPVF